MQSEQTVDQTVYKKYGSVKFKVGIGKPIVKNLLGLLNLRVSATYSLL